MELSQYSLLANAIKAACPDIQGFGPPEPSWGSSTPTLSELKSAIDSGKSNLPDRYEPAYVNPLLSYLPKLATSSHSTSVTEELVGAVSQHAVDSPVRTQLRQFLVVVHDLYASFLSEEKLNRADLSLTETIAPLASFMHKGSGGPSTLVMKTLNKAFGAKVAVVSLPSVYRDHPVMWAGLAHEVGGHDILFAIPDLVPELVSVILDHFGSNQLASGVQPTPTQKTGLLWAYWINETASDCYGMLNIGPSFQFVQTAYFSCLISNSPGNRITIPHVRTYSIQNSKKILDPHPTDILRIAVGQGVVANLTKLKSETKESYCAQLAEIIDIASAEATTISLHGTAKVGDAQYSFSAANGEPCKYPIDEMMTHAREVGKLIVTSKLKALNGKSIQDIETWDDTDESIAQAVAQSTISNTKLQEGVDAAHLLAGAGIAAFENPEKYVNINQILASNLSALHEKTWL